MGLCLEGYDARHDQQSWCNRGHQRSTKENPLQVLVVSLSSQNPFHFTFNAMSLTDLDSWIFDPDKIDELFDHMPKGYYFAEMDLNGAMMDTSWNQKNTETPTFKGYENTANENTANTMIPSSGKSDNITIHSLTNSVSSANSRFRIGKRKKEPKSTERTLCENAVMDLSCSTMGSLCSTTDSFCSTTDSSCSTSTDSSASNESNKNNTNVQVKDNDVLFGRGSRSNGHPGNQRYLQRILDSQRAYKILDFDGKRALIQVVVCWVELQGGRFLAFEKNAEGRGRYYVASDQEVHVKISQALREDHTPEGRAAKKSRLTRQE